MNTHVKKSPRGPGRPQKDLDGEDIKIFLETLSECGNVTHSCRKAGLNKRQAYVLYDRYPLFKAMWDEAAAIGAKALEDEARRRAYMGWEDPIIYQGRPQMVQEINSETGEVTEVPLTVRKYSDTLLIFLLKGHYPEKYRDRISQEVSGPGGGPIDNQINVRFIRPGDQKGSESGPERES